MRVAVATIALNEEKFVERWAAASGDADVLVIGDTGSVDGTVEAALDLGVVVHRLSVRPWRFDVARNALLALLPDDVDVVINADVDEVLVEGWRAGLEAAPAADRYFYDYVFSWTADGEPDVRFRADKCHSRAGWMWRHPCHETLFAVGADPRVEPGGFALHHYPDPGKSRGQYLGLLQQAARESPDDPRMSHYLAREFFFHGDWDAARAEFVRHLGLKSAVWAAERAESYRYLAKMDYDPERWLLRAVAEDPRRRDAFVDLVDLYLEQGMRAEAAGAAARALRIPAGFGDYMSGRHAQNDEFLMSVVEGAGTGHGVSRFG